MTEKRYEFIKDLKAHAGTRVANEIARKGVWSKDELKEYVYDHKYIWSNCSGHHDYWSGIGVESYYKIINYLYPKEEA